MFLCSLFCVVFTTWGPQPDDIPDVGVVVVRDVLHCEDLAVLLGFLVLWPEGRIGLKIRISQFC